MVFNSLTFVAFFALVVGLHALPLSWTSKKANLLVASYLFYAAWNPAGASRRARLCQGAHLPRAETWELLLARTGRPGVHFEDHAAMRGLELPEWSHLTARDAERYTEALATEIQRAQLWRVATAPIQTPTDAPAAAPATAGTGQ